MGISPFQRMGLVRTDRKEISCGTNYSDEQSREVRGEAMELYRGLSDITGGWRGPKLLRMGITWNADERCYRVIHMAHLQLILLNCNIRSTAVTSSVSIHTAEFSRSRECFKITDYIVT